jgi:hypothetical protein
MALIFPTAPTTGQIFPTTFTAGVPQFNWDGSAWSSTLTGADRYEVAQAIASAQQIQARQNVYAAPFDALAFNGMQMNGNMEVSQERGTTAVTGILNQGFHIVDGWYAQASGTTGVLSAQQVADAPPGYANSLKVSVTTPLATIPVTNIYSIYHGIETYRLSRLAEGTASASPLSVAFWCKVNRPGLYSGAIQGGSTTVTRSCPFSFTMTSSGVWQFIAVTIPGDTTVGSWTPGPAGNIVGMWLEINMAAGTNFQAPAGVWVTGDKEAVTGQINGIAATTDYMQITGVVMLPGIELPSAARAPFIMRPFDQELQLCQRQYEKTYIYADLPGTAYASAAGGGALGSYIYNLASYAPTPFWTFKVRKRAVPTMTYFSPWTGASGSIRDQNGSVDVPVVNSSIGETGAQASVNNVAVQAVNNIWAHMVADARI